MYEFIRGTLIHALPHKAILEAAGIGYSIEIPVSTFSLLPGPGEQLLLYISFLVREDDQRLFGFISQQERDLFDTVRSVTGIGPKTALSLIGHLPLPELERAILQNSTPLLTKVPGIGKKIAERLIMELKDKLGKTGRTAASFSLPANGPANIRTDAVSALINLGYSPLQADQAVRKAQENDDNLPLPQLITRSLRHV